MKGVFRPLRMETWVGPTTPDWDRRSRYVFSASWQDTLNKLDRELYHLGAENFVIEADFSESDIRLDGLPRSNARQPAFPGVRIAFDSHHGPLVYQADSCAYWQHNVRSIALGLEALRAVDRYGITHRAEQYTGFRAIEAKSPNFTGPLAATAWLADRTGIVGAEGLSTKALVKQAARRCHPDHGATRGEWDLYQEAVALLKKEGLL